MYQEVCSVLGNEMQLVPSHGGSRGVCGEGNNALFL